MRIEVSRRVRLFVLGGVGAGIVFEEREDGQRIPVHILRGPEAARRWAESHYECVDWESPHRAGASVGRLTNPALPPPPAAHAGDWEYHPLTYQTVHFRAYLPALVAGDTGLVILQRYEERTSELDRWEPFVDVLWSAVARQEGLSLTGA